MPSKTIKDLVIRIIHFSSTLKSPLATFVWLIYIKERTTFAAENRKNNKII